MASVKKRGQSRSCGRRFSPGGKHAILGSMNSPARRIAAFPPILGPEPRVLILGSMPSVESLRRREYYGNPRNHFWPLMYRVLGAGELPERYPERERLLKECGIAVWDVFEACEREGSLDSRIALEEYRDVGAFLRANPSIRAVLFNGTKAEQGFRRGLAFYGHNEVRAQVLRLPSTSPIPTKKYRKKEDKLAAWMVIAEYLDQKSELQQ